MASRLAHRLGLTGRELGLLCLAVGLGVAVRLAFVVATRGHVLAGDEIEIAVGTGLRREVRPAPRADPSVHC